jgi:hypothetical protein
MPFAEEAFMSASLEPVPTDENGARYFAALGEAAADLWSHLPQELQQMLFERAVMLGHKGERDESLREQLAKFLHDHHERTRAP